MRSQPLVGGFQRSQPLAVGPWRPRSLRPHQERQDKEWLQCSPSLPNLGIRVAIVHRTGGDLRPARHCCHSTPDITTSRRSPAPTRACRHGPGRTGPTDSREPGRRLEPHQSDPREVGPQQSARPFLGTHAPLTR